MNNVISTITMKMLNRVASMSVSIFRHFKYMILWRNANFTSIFKDIKGKWLFQIFCPLNRSAFMDHDNDSNTSWYLHIFLHSSCQHVHWGGECSKTTTLVFQRVDFELFRTVVGTVPWDSVLKGRGVQEGWLLPKKEVLKWQEQAVLLCHKTS